MMLSASSVSMKLLTSSITNEVHHINYFEVTHSIPNIHYMNIMKYGITHIIYYC